jgi:uncharacterized protein with FMN-binding domain
VHPPAPRHRATVALIAGVALTGCGQHTLHRSDRPAAITTSQAPASARSTTSPTGPQATGTFTGANVLTKFGDVQVSLTLAHGRITDVQWLKLPYDRRRSQYISQNASPILRSEVLSAQSAHIDLVSGATYTSEAWANSVQSALAQTR